MDWLSNLWSGATNALGGAGRSVGGFLGNMLGMGGGGSGGASNMMSASGGPNEFMGGAGGNRSASFNPAQYAQYTMARQGGGGGGGLMGPFNPRMMGAGLGVMGLGQMMSPRVNMPNFQQNPQVQQLTNWNQTANHPLDPNVQQSIQNSLNIQNEQQLRNLRDVYKNLRPGTDYATDTNYQRDLGVLNRQMGMNAADAMGTQQLASNQQHLANLQNLAELGVGQGMGQASLNAQRIGQRNQMMGNLGSMLMMRGLGMPMFMGGFNLGGR